MRVKRVEQNFISQNFISPQIFFKSFEILFAILYHHQRNQWRDHHRQALLSQSRKLMADFPSWLVARSFSRNIAIKSSFIFLNCLREPSRWRNSLLRLDRVAGILPKRVLQFHWRFDLSLQQRDSSSRPVS